MKPTLMNMHLDGDLTATTLNRGVKAALIGIAVLSMFVTLGVAAKSVHRRPLAQAEVQATEIKVQ